LISDAEARARGERAQTLRDEFLAPILGEIRDSYAQRIVEVATKELDPKRRTEAVTSLSVAIRVLDNIESGLNAFIHDGEVAAKSQLRAERIEKMPHGQRRLLSIAPY
jgi:hypothetical protein